MKYLHAIPKLCMILILYAADPAWAEPERTAEERINALSSRIERLEKQEMEGRWFIDWIDAIEITGLVEAEAAYSRFKPAAGGTEESSDIVLSTMELGVDVGLNDYVSGHLLFLWEESETETVDLDEGFITISGGDKLPFFLSAGKFYIPFGNYESNFISDPLALELGETNESGVLLGFDDGAFNLSAGVFNGDVDENGENDHIGSGFGSAALALAPDALPGLTINTGVSWISNLADSDLLGEANDLDGDGESDGIRDSVSGISGFLSLACRERLFLIAEYVGALARFREEDFATGPEKFKPRAWNTELAYVFDSGYGCGIKYEGARDTAGLLPETRYGAIAFCHPFEGVFLGIEYLREEYKNKDKGDAVTLQLAYEF